MGLCRSPVVPKSHKEKVQVTCVFIVLFLLAMENIFVLFKPFKPTAQAVALLGSCLYWKSCMNVTKSSKANLKILPFVCSIHNMRFDHYVHWSV